MPGLEAAINSSWDAYGVSLADLQVFPAQFTATL